jgi:hypothetical protein
MVYQYTTFYWTNVKGALIRDNKQEAELDAPLTDT